MWYGGAGSSTPYQIGYATSTNRTSWMKYGAVGPTQGLVITPTAVGSWGGLPVQDVSMPCVINDGSTYKMWFTATTDLAGPDQINFQIGYAESSDGITWTNFQGSPVLPKGNTASDWDGEGVSGAMVIKDETAPSGERYKMWYYGYNSAYDIPGIGYAISPDGITWTKHNDTATVGNPFAISDPVIKLGAVGSWNGYNLGAPTVIKEDSYRMWYAGDADASMVDKIGFAYSDDGISWQDYNGNPVLNPGPAEFDSGDVNKPSVIKDGNTYKMWYTGYSSTGVPTIGYAESSAALLYANFAGYGLYKWDGSSWTQINPANPANMVASGSVLYANFAGYGLYKWDSTAWSQITPSNPAIMMTGF
jgi:hypothetical protein